MIAAIATTMRAALKALLGVLLVLKVAGRVVLVVIEGRLVRRVALHG